MNSENENLVQQIQQSFLDLLNDYLPKSFLEKVKQGKKLKVISIGCGRFRELNCLLKYFSGHKDKITFYGIDIDEELINLAKKNPVLNQRNVSVELKLGDASLLENYKEWTNDGYLFDLVIIRHPEITFNTNAFINIFSVCVSLLTVGGSIFITTHYENEKESLKPLLKLLKFNVIVDVENKNSPSLKKGDELVYSDKYLLIASKA